MIDIKAEIGELVRREFDLSLNHQIPITERYAMSSLPGLALEDFLAWNYDIVVIGRQDANWNLMIAEALGKSGRARCSLTPKLFKPLVDLFEKHREYVERKLKDFDEETQNWRDYAGAVFGYDVIPKEDYTAGDDYLNSLWESTTPLCRF